MVQKTIKNKIEKILLEKFNLKNKIEITKSKGYGDFSTNIAMKISKELKDSPLNIAKKIIKNIDLDIISKIEVVKPGFINIFLNEKTFLNFVENILKQKNDFGKNKQNKYINIEFVSANPTGFLHIGHARGAVLGSVLSNILKFAGNKVDNEYYINDAGNQMKVLGESVKVRYLQEFGEKIELPENSYKGQDIVWVAKKFVKKYQDSLKEQNAESFIDEAGKMLLEKIKKDLKDYGVEFDIFSSELDIYKQKLIEKSIKKLGDKVYKKDGATWLKTKIKGDQKDRVLVKSDGTCTYLMPDLAYHDLKISRGYDELINIWGADHIGYIKRMEVAIGYLGLPSDKLDIFVVQFVKLMKNNQELKMSKRMGTSYTIEEFLKEVNLDSARWFMIDRSQNSEFTFDINAANSDDSSNAVFYVQYTYARANQLINKSTNKNPFGFYSTKEKELINLLNEFPELINTISKNHKVNLLPQYLIKVSSLFNSWYSKVRILNNKKEAIQIKLVKATSIVLENSLKLLGINAPKKM